MLLFTRYSLLHTRYFFMADFLQTLNVAVVLGSLYALIALGYTMVFGVLKLINFAHSDIVVLGAWISIVATAWLLPTIGIDLATAPWWSPLLVLAIAMGTCGAIGFCIERFAYRPIRKAPRLNALITAIGVSLLLQNAGQLQFPIVRATPKMIVAGNVATRVDARHVTLDRPVTIDSGGTFALRFTERAGATPEDRPLALRPGTYAAGAEIALDRGLPARFATATFELVRTNLPLSLPFGAAPASIPRGLMPEDVGTLTPEQRAKTAVWLPNKAVLLQLNFYEAGVDGARIYKPVRLTLVDATIVVVAAALMIGLQVLVFGTRVGTAMRAVSYNLDTAALMGIPVDRIISLVFVLGTMLAAAAGFLYALKYAAIKQPADTSWTLLGLKAFVAAVVGGIGNLKGATVGGFLIAFIEAFSAYGGQQLGWDRISALTDVFVFALLIVVLLVKPTGLFGSVVREKV